jgi:hypothetical protein
MKIINDLNEVRADLAPLYAHYKGQINPQPAYLWIDLEKKTVEADYSGEVGQGGVPERVWHGLVRRVDITPYIKGSALADLLESKELAGYVQRMIDGFESVWDNSNWVAKLTPDAERAERELELHLIHAIDLTSDTTTVYTAYEWFENAMVTDEDKATITIPDVGTITADSTDAELEAMAKKIRKDAEDEGIYIEPRITDTLEELRADCARMRDELNAE